MNTPVTRILTSSRRQIKTEVVVSFFGKVKKMYKKNTSQWVGQPQAKEAICKKKTIYDRSCFLAKPFDPFFTIS